LEDEVGQAETVGVEFHLEELRNIARGDDSPERHIAGGWADGDAFDLGDPELGKIRRERSLKRKHVLARVRSGSIDG